MNKLVCSLGKKQTFCSLCLINASRKDPKLLVLTDSAQRCCACGKEPKIDPNI